MAGNYANVVEHLEMTRGEDSKEDFITEELVTPHDFTEEYLKGEEIRKWKAECTILKKENEKLRLAMQNLLIKQKESLSEVYVQEREFEQPNHMNQANARFLNVITYNIDEYEHDNEAYDRFVVRRIFGYMNGLQDNDVTFIGRRGVQRPYRNRPVVISFSTQEAKISFMSQIWKLKDGPFMFQKINVSEDYTRRDRRLLREWIKEAKKKTKRDSPLGIRWVVVNTRSGGLKLEPKDNQTTNSSYHWGDISLPTYSPPFQSFSLN